MKNKNLSSNIIVIVLLAILGFILYLIFAPSRNVNYSELVGEAQAVGENYLQSLKDGDYPTAFALLDTELQNEKGAPNELAYMIPSPKTYQSWTYQIYQVETTDGGEALAMIGEMTLIDGSVMKMEVILDIPKGEDEIKVIGFNLRFR